MELLLLPIFIFKFAKLMLQVFVIAPLNNTYILPTMCLIAMFLLPLKIDTMDENVSN